MKIDQSTKLFLSNLYAAFCALCYMCGILLVVWLGIAFFEALSSGLHWNSFIIAFCINFVFWPIFWRFVREGAQYDHGDLT